MSSEAQLIFILGGARSGKSSFAERLAVQSQRSVAYIATAVAYDDDMRERITHHRSSRPATWVTIEESLHLHKAIQQAAEQADVILIDCVTTWLSNWLFAQGQVDTMAESEISANYYDGALQQIQLLLQTVETLAASKRVLVVSNEVGLGIVPAYPLGRVYRDVLGLVNQRVAARASKVYLMIAGLGVDIKRLHQEANLDE